MVAQTPAALIGFSAEYLGDHPAYSELDQYLRTEFDKIHPGWEPRFGMASWFDSDTRRYDHLYLITGSVPGASTESAAHDTVHKALDRIAAAIRRRRPKDEKALPTPVIKTWRWRPQSL